MSKDNITIVTGGGTGKEGLKVWDMRNLKEPKLQINWTSNSQNPLFNCVKLFKGHNMVIAGTNDVESPAKCFNTLTGEMWEQFRDLERSCLTIDIAPDQRQLILGDASGKSLIYDVCFNK